MFTLFTMTLIKVSWYMSVHSSLWYQRRAGTCLFLPHNNIIKKTFGTCLYLLLFIRALGICPRCTAAVETYCASLVFLNFPTFAARLPPRPCYPRGPSLRKVELLGRGTWPTIFPRMHDFHGTFRDLLHAANLRHGTDGFTFTPKEGVLRIFSP